MPIAAGRTVTFVYVDPGNDTIAELRHWGQSHEHVWAGIRKHGMQVHVAAIALHSKAENRARSVLNGWARDRRGIKAGSYREAELQNELDTVSRGIDTFNFEIFARYGGQQKTARRYRELKDMLARPLPYNIRIDTFEIWRSERIYPDGVDLYQAPA